MALRESAGTPGRKKQTTAGPSDKNRRRARKPRPTVQRRQPFPQSLESKTSCKQPSRCFLLPPERGTFPFRRHQPGPLDIKPAIESIIFKWMSWRKNLPLRSDRLQAAPLYAALGEAAESKRPSGENIPRLRSVRRGSFPIPRGKRARDSSDMIP